MKAVLSKETGGPETLVVEEIDIPTAGSGEVLVKVAACAINFPDTLIIRDMYQFKPPRPFAPGGEISGTIEALGEGVTDFAVGDRVMCGVGNGGLQEKVVVPAAKLFKVPDGIDLVAFDPAVNEARLARKSPDAAPPLALPASDPDASRYIERKGFFVFSNFSPKTKRELSNFWLYFIIFSIE